jgi:hypothetical protein
MSWAALRHAFISDPRHAANGKKNPNPKCRKTNRLMHAVYQWSVAEVWAWLIHVPYLGFVLVALIALAVVLAIWGVLTRE